MKHIRFFRIICAAMAAAMLTGCAVETDPAASSSATSVATAADTVIAPPEQAASTLFGVPYRPTEIVNPITDPVRMNRDLYTLVFDTLFGLDERFRPVMTLCSDAVFEDDVTLALTVRDDVFFHTGAPLTGADVAYSLELARTDENSVYRERLDCVKSVVFEGGSRVTLILSEPRPSILSLLDIPVIREGTGRDSDAVGSGRYRMMDSDGQRYLLLNESHWSGMASEAVLTHMLLVSVADADAMVYGASAGNLDIFRADMSGGVRLHANADRYAVDTDELLCAVFRTDGGVFGDETVRKAAAAMFCGGRLAECAADEIKPAPSFYPPLLEYGISAPTAGTPQALRSALLAVDGWQLNGDGGLTDAVTQQPPTVTVLVRSDDGIAYRIAEAVRDGLREAGIDARIEEKTGAEFDSDVQKSKYDVYIDTYRAGADFDLTGLVSGRVSDPDLPALLRAYRQSGVEHGAILARQIVERIRAESSVIPVGYLRREILLNRKYDLYGVTMTDHDLFFNIFEWKRDGGK